MTEFLRTNIADQMRGSVRVTIRVAIETRHASMSTLRTPVVSLIELLLRKRSHQEANSFDLFWIQDPVEQLKKVIDCDQLALGHVAQVWSGRQKNGCGKFRQKMVRQIKVQIEPC